MNINKLLNPLTELFSVKDDEPYFDSSNEDTTWSEKASMADFEKVHTLYGNIVYALAGLRYNPNTREMLHKLKLKLKDEELSKFINFITNDISLLMNELKIDYLVQVPSSSLFLRNTMQSLSSLSGVPLANFLSIKKVPIQNLKFNKRSPQLEGMDRYDIEEVKSQVMKHIRHQIEDDNEYLEAKRFPKNLLGFITNFFEVSGDVKQLEGKRVLIVDDNLSSGNTMKDIVDMFSLQYKAQTSGLVIFKLKM